MSKIVFIINFQPNLTKVVYVLRNGRKSSQRKQICISGRIALICSCSRPQTRALKKDIIKMGNGTCQQNSKAVGEEKGDGEEDGEACFK